ncbi:hypothetical protein D3C75_258920 [compost metagenome]
MRTSLHGEFAVFRNPVLPGQCLDALEQFVEGSGRKLAHLDQYPVRGAQPQIAAANIDIISAKEDAAVLGDRLVAKLVQFAGDNSLQTHRGGGDQLQFAQKNLNSIACE